MRAGWRRQLLLLTGIAALLTVAVLSTGAVLFKLAVIALPPAALLTRAPAGLRRSRLSVLRECCDSWLTYQPPPLPGLLQSPLGSAHHRAGMLMLATIITAILFISIPESPLSLLFELGQRHHLSVLDAYDLQEASLFESMRYGTFVWILTFLSTLILPVALPWLLALSLASPVLMEAAACNDQASGDNPTQLVLADMRRSPDRTERGSVYLGRVVADGSPVQIPRDVFSEHAHGLGDSGGGKTSLFLCPLIEQLGMTGECSIIVIDNKADTLELLASLQAVAESVRRERSEEMPLKVFSNQADKASFAFNPMTQPFWSNFDLFTRTDIICGANGLTYGSDYGQGYYSSANAAILYHTLKTFPHVSTFSELADCIAEVTVSASKRELHPEIRKAGVHVMEVMKRLAACTPLNVTPEAEQDRAVVAQAIDFTQVFTRPQLQYFHLSATLSPSGAPEIARLVTYMLLAAATQTKRSVPVFLVIDEFQRMVASNLEYMLQLARSMGVGVILANQSMEDLKHSTTNLIPAIEANCRLRQWFSVSSTDDQERLMQGSGVTVDYSLGRSVSCTSDGKRSVTRSQNETVVNRITINDVALTNDHRFRSFLHLKRGAGYAQFGGLPVIIESGYHISEDEYRRRKALPWPRLPGSFVPNERRDGATAPSAPAPTRKWTEDIIDETNGGQHGDDDDDESRGSDPMREIETFFDQLRDSLPRPKRGRKRS